MSKDLALVVCPLQSLMKDQIAEARSKSFIVNSLPEASLEDMGVWKFQLFIRSLAIVVVDVSHTVETWSEKRCSYVIISLSFFIKKSPSEFMHLVLVPNFVN